MNEQNELNFNDYDYIYFFYENDLVSVFQPNCIHHVLNRPYCKNVLVQEHRLPMDYVYMDNMILYEHGLQLLHKTHNYVTVKLDIEVCHSDHANNVMTKFEMVHHFHGKNCKMVLYNFSLIQY